MLYILLLYFLFVLVGNFLYFQTIFFELIGIISISILILVFYNQKSFLTNILSIDMLKKAKLGNKFIIIKYLFYISYVCLLLIYTPLGYYLLYEKTNSERVIGTISITALLSPIFFIFLLLIYLKKFYKL